MQRAHGSIREMDPAVRGRETVILPSHKGVSSHQHALWSDAFFEELDKAEFLFPAGVNGNRIRDLAVYHHHPGDPRHWLIAEADRLASGLDRKAKDEEQERGSWQAFRKTPLQSLFSFIAIGQGTAPATFQPLEELRPGPGLCPVDNLEPNDLPARYEQLWPRFMEAVLRLSGSRDESVFIDALLSVLERFTSAIPSSTMDLPDISLYDHARMTAAIAAVLLRFHEHHGEISNEPVIKDRDRLKFRFLSGDLSGIQNSLFLLAHQQVKGVNRILRARSLLLGLLLEGTVLLCRKQFDLPSPCVIQNAGGKFLLLVPDLAELPGQVQGLARQVEHWIRQRYFGELGLNLVLSQPFAGRDLMDEGRLAKLLARQQVLMAEAKLRGMPEEMTRPVTAVTYPHDLCRACGLRPAEVPDPFEPEKVVRCRGCHDEWLVGGWLPETVAIGWREAQQARDRGIPLLNRLEIRFLKEEGEGSSESWLSLYRIHRGEEESQSPLPLRYLANYVPVVAVDEQVAGWSAGLGDEALEVKPGGAKTFEHLAACARERVGEDWIGKPFLAVLKADVDHLGLIFHHTARRGGLSRVAALSRQMDLFFTGQLRWLITGTERFRHTYTVYAGGDDLLLIGPWRQTIELAGVIQEQFARFTGRNPNITLSAGLELIAVNQPLNRAVATAEQRLEDAKESGRNRVSLIAHQAIPWSRLPILLDQAGRISDDIRGQVVGTGFVHRLLAFGAQRRKAEQGDVTHADWRARWGYHVRRNVLNRLSPEERATEGADLVTFYGGLLGLDQWLRPVGSDPGDAIEIPVTIALYRNRS
ncbi:MAG: type III-A CRISPR-associated protein Cas10/Csm1 [Magnetococcales bacterium]|nr:type III-A CRISPR-associated protein Cas10/Csm1 [Magnetococcales bacterium]